MSRISPSLLSAYVWLLSGICLLAYAFFGLLEHEVYGIEELVLYLSTINGHYIFVAAFLVILIEGIYLIGNFFPGSTILVILVLGSQSQGGIIFFLTTLTIFLGWFLSGFVNIGLGRFLLLKTTRSFSINRKPYVSANVWLSWFPAFRSNYEVSQIIEGHGIFDVLKSSSQVKFYTSLIMMSVLYIISMFINVSEVNNEEGFFSLFIVAVICLIIGYSKMKQGVD